MLQKPRFAAAGGADQQDVALVQAGGSLVALALAVALPGQALVVVVDGHRQHLLGLFLSHHLLIEVGLDLHEHLEPLDVVVARIVEVREDALLHLLEDALERLPEEIRQARWLLKEREEFLQKVQREADEKADAGEPVTPIGARVRELQARAASLEASL